MDTSHLNTNRKEVLEKNTPLKFGTSGLRDLVEAMTDMECYINARGFIRFLKERGESRDDSLVAVGGDRRASTPRIMASVIKAIEDEGCKSEYVGLVPSPALVNLSIVKGIPSIMVTGSHIPDDRNGIKFTKASGEVLKSDESDILRNVASARQQEYSKSWEETIFSEKGMFQGGRHLPEAESEASEAYIKRYLDVFPDDALAGRKIVLYQHSAVGRDMIADIFKGIGADLVTVGRSETFVPVDTEKISDTTNKILLEAAKEHKPFAIVSTDGDSDRPLLADENGKFLPGDKLGALVSVYLKPDFAAIPISANPAVVKGLAREGIALKQTKIGSPYVIAAMNEELEKDRDAKVVSWESNGGFLLGSNWDIGGKELMLLPSRDAVLPLLSAILLAIADGASLSETIEKRLPAFYTAAGVVDNKDKGLEDYTSSVGKEIIAKFSPKDPSITEISFESDPSPEALSIKEKLLKYFNEENGFGELIGVNFLDGVRMRFRTSGGKEEISHLRPSGNAPEFRNYAAAETEARAQELADKRYEIIPQIVADMK